MRRNLHSIYILILTCYLTKSVSAQTFLDLETGPVITGYNDLRIPGDIGTLFSLKNDLSAKIKIFYRLRASYTLHSRYTISLLYAPLEISSVGKIPNKINFNRVVFDAETEMKSIYKFNSYRLTFRYDIITQKNIVFGLGITAKIRDAYIHLYSTKQSAKLSSIGFLPIMNFNLLWKINDSWDLILNGDALITPQGRAEDIQLALTYQYTDPINFRIGYRILEGGTDSNSSYGFALFHYASLGCSYSFKKKMNE